jgi:hydrogenase maturation protease
MIEFKLSEKMIDTTLTVKPTPPSILLVACGNSLRSDDGAGLLLAERMTQLWQAQGVSVRYESVHQLTPELAATIADDALATVIFVDTRDATAEGDEPQVQIRAISSRAASPGLGHQLDPTTLLLYTHRLYDKQPSAWLITVPGIDFGHGEGLSSVAGEALQAAEGYLADLISLF